MGTEIERKFLVRGVGWRGAVERSARFVQGYLGGDLCSVRVRTEDDAAFLNVKSKTLGIERLEFEFAIPPAEARELLAAFCPDRIDKRRHFVHHAGHCWEIDEFAARNAGLVVAEIELARADEAFERPPWLGEEVSADPRFYNVNLVRTPFATWPDRERYRAAE